MSASRPMERVHVRVTSSRYSNNNGRKQSRRQMSRDEQEQQGELQQPPPSLSPSPSPLPLPLALPASASASASASAATRVPAPDGHLNNVSVGSEGALPIDLVMLDRETLSGARRHTHGQWRAPPLSARERRLEHDVFAANTLSLEMVVDYGFVALHRVALAMTQAPQVSRELFLKGLAPLHQARDKELRGRRVPVDTLLEAAGGAAGGGGGGGGAGGRGSNVFDNNAGSRRARENSFGGLRRQNASGRREGAGVHRMPEATLGSDGRIVYDERTKARAHERHVLRQAVHFRILVGQIRLLMSVQQDNFERLTGYSGMVSSLQEALSDAAGRAMDQEARHEHRKEELAVAVAQDEAHSKLASNLQHQLRQSVSELHRISEELRRADVKIVASEAASTASQQQISKLERSLNRKEKQMERAMKALADVRQTAADAAADADAANMKEHAARREVRHLRELFAQRSSQDMRSTAALAHIAQIPVSVLSQYLSPHQVQQVVSEARVAQKLGHSNMNIESSDYFEANLELDRIIDAERRKHEAKDEDIIEDSMLAMIQDQVRSTGVSVNVDNDWPVVEVSPRSSPTPRLDSSLKVHENSPSRSQPISAKEQSPAIGFLNPDDGPSPVPSSPDGSDRKVQQSGSAAFPSDSVSRQSSGASAGDARPKRHRRAISDLDGVSSSDASNFPHPKAPLVSATPQYTSSRHFGFQARHRTMAPGNKLPPQSTERDQLVKPGAAQSALVVYVPSDQQLKSLSVADRRASINLLKARVQVLMGKDAAAASTPVIANGVVLGSNVGLSQEENNELDQSMHALDVLLSQEKKESRRATLQQLNLEDQIRAQMVKMQQEEEEKDKLEQAQMAHFAAGLPGPAPTRMSMRASGADPVYSDMTAQILAAAENVREDGDTYHSEGMQKPSVSDQQEDSASMTPPLLQMLASRKQSSSSIHPPVQTPASAPDETVEAAPPRSAKRLVINVPQSSASISMMSPRDSQRSAESESGNVDDPVSDMLHAPPSGSREAVRSMIRRRSVYQDPVSDDDDVNDDGTNGANVARGVPTDQMSHSDAARAAAAQHENTAVTNSPAAQTGSSSVASPPAPKDRATIIRASTRGSTTSIRTGVRPSATPRSDVSQAAASMLAAKRASKRLSKRGSARHLEMTLLAQAMQSAQKPDTSKSRTRGSMRSSRHIPLSRRGSEVSIGHPVTPKVPSVVDSDASELQTPASRRATRRGTLRSSNKRASLRASRRMSTKNMFGGIGHAEAVAAKRASMSSKRGSMSSKRGSMVLSRRGSTKRSSTRSSLRGSVRINTPEISSALSRRSSARNNQMLLALARQQAALTGTLVDAQDSDDEGKDSDDSTESRSSAGSTGGASPEELFAALTGRTAESVPKKLLTLKNVAKISAALAQKQMAPSKRKKAQAMLDQLIASVKASKKLGKKKNKMKNAAEILKALSTGKKSKRASTRVKGLRLSMVEGSRPGDDADDAPRLTSAALEDHLASVKSPSAEDRDQVPLSITSPRTDVDGLSSSRAQSQASRRSQRASRRTAVRLSGMAGALAAAKAENEKKAASAIDVGEEESTSEAHVPAPKSPSDQSANIQEEAAPDTEGTSTVHADDEDDASVWRRQQLSFSGAQHPDLLVSPRTTASRWNESIVPHSDAGDNVADLIARSRQIRAHFQEQLMAHQQEQAHLNVDLRATSPVSKYAGASPSRYGDDRTSEQVDANQWGALTERVYAWKEAMEKEMIMPEIHDQSSTRLTILRDGTDSVGLSDSSLPSTASLLSSAGTPLDENQSDFIQSKRFQHSDSRYILIDSDTDEFATRWREPSKHSPHIGKHFPGWTSPSKMRGVGTAKAAASVHKATRRIRLFQERSPNVKPAAAASVAGGGGPQLAGGQHEGERATFAAELLSPALLTPLQTSVESDNLPDELQDWLDQL